MRKKATLTGKVLSVILNDKLKSVRKETVALWAQTFNSQHCSSTVLGSVPSNIRWK